MAAPTPSATGSVRLNIVDGRREPIPESMDVHIRILDGRKNPIADVFKKGPVIPILGLPFRDNGDDLYTIVVSAGGYQDAGLYPIRLQAGRLIDAWAMLVPEGGRFHFSKIDALRADKGLAQLVLNGSEGDPGARYSTAIEEQPMNMGALLTIGAAIRDIPVDVAGANPFSFYWEVIWDLLMPDRFFAWVERGLADRIAALAKLHSFAEEKDAAHWHPGIDGRVHPATRSWKQTRFDVTNVQLTFHESNTRVVTTPDGRRADCVIVEPDIDFFRDVLAHGLLEVLPNLVTGGKTDARRVYSMRWMATQLEGIAGGFNPPCTVE